MTKCRGCGRYFKTQGGLKSHLSMVRRTGRHYPRKKGNYRRRSYKRPYRRKSYRRSYRRRRY